MNVSKLLLYRTAEAALEKTGLDEMSYKALACKIVDNDPQSSDISAKVDLLHTSNQSVPALKDVGKEWYWAAMAAVVALKEKGITPKAAENAVAGALRFMPVSASPSYLESAASHFAAQAMEPSSVHFRMNELMMGSLGISANGVLIAVSNAAKAIVTVIIYAKKQEEYIAQYRKLEKKIGTTPIPDEDLREKQPADLQALIARFDSAWTDMEGLIKAAKTCKIKLPIDDLVKHPEKRGPAKDGIKVVIEIRHYDPAASERARIGQIQNHFQDYLDGNEKPLEKMLIIAKGEHVAEEYRKRLRGGGVKSCLTEAIIGGVLIVAGCRGLFYSQDWIFRTLTKDIVPTSPGSTLDQMEEKFGTKDKETNQIDPAQIEFNRINRALDQMEEKLKKETNQIDPAQDQFDRFNRAFDQMEEQFGIKGKKK